MDEKESKTPKVPAAEKKPSFLFRKKQGGVYLTKGQIKEIKKGRKELRRELKKQGLKSREDFNVIASGRNLYFDRSGKRALVKMFFLGKGGLMLIGAAILLLFVLWMVSWITAMRGHFTINMSSDLFSQGFTLSENADFTNPTSYLMCEPLNHVPEISISNISADVTQTDGMHSSNYFAYTYYIRNSGSSAADYKWEFALNSESQNVSSAVWVMIFEDDKMTFYAREGADGKPEYLPSKGDSGRGYAEPPLYSMAKNPKEQYEQISSGGAAGLWRVVPKPFESETTVTHGIRENMAVGETHKYTIVMWLEGDDPDCTDALVGGHLGMEIYMSLLEDDANQSADEGEWKDTWEDFWSKIFG